MKTMRLAWKSYTARFVIFTYAVSWMFFSPLVWGYFINDYRQLSEIPNGFLYLFLGSLGPFASAVWVTFLRDGSSGVRKLMLKLIDWRHKFRFYLLSLYVVPVSLFAVLFILHLIGLVEFKFELYPLLMINLLANVVIGILPLTFVVGPFGEELGWRGYLLPRLLEKFHPIKSSLLIGIIWACWHLPLFLFDDWTFGMPFYLYFPLYLCSVTFMSITFSWLHLKVNGSVLIAMILHYSINYTLANYLKLFTHSTGTVMEVVIILATMALPGLLFIFLLSKNPQSR